MKLTGRMRPDPIPGAPGERGLFAHYAGARPPSANAPPSEAALLFLELLFGAGVLMLTAMAALAAWVVLS